MATILKNVVRFTGLVAGVPVALPHRLNLDGIALIPEFVAANASGFAIAADATNVTVTPSLNAGDAVDVFVEFFYSPGRVFDPANSPPAGFPFFAPAGGGGGLATYLDGSDNDATYAINTTLIRVHYFENLTVDAGVTLSLNHNRIYVRNRLINNGVIATRGNDAVGAVAGAAIPTSSFVLAGNQGGGKGGGGGGINAGSNATGDATKGVGGNGGDGGAGTAGAGGAGAVMGTLAANTDFRAQIGHLMVAAGSVIASRAGGGGGGGGGDGVNSGGGGGGGAGFMQIFARYVENNGVITLAGGDGAPGTGGDAGGGGGGGGGVGQFVHDEWTGALPIAPGGNGGAGVGGGAAGVDGADGIIVMLQNR